MTSECLWETVGDTPFVYVLFSFHDTRAWPCTCSFMAGTCNKERGVIIMLLISLDSLMLCLFINIHVSTSSSEIGNGSLVGVLQNGLNYSSLSLIPLAKFY